MNKPVENFTADVGAGVIDQRALRTTLGAFPTGVTVVTALSSHSANSPDLSNSQCIGLTVSSFNTVSLDPPLIVWSLALSSSSLEAFRNADRYVVNVLALDQAWLSQHFATKKNDKFANLEISEGLGGAPLLPGCCAWFECLNEIQYPGGDHLMFVGRVERFSHVDKEPLVFHGGQYRALKDL